MFNDWFLGFLLYQNLKPLCFFFLEMWVKSKKQRNFNVSFDGNSILIYFSHWFFYRILILCWTLDSLSRLKLFSFTSKFDFYCLHSTIVFFIEPFLLLFYSSHYSNPFDHNLSLNTLNPWNCVCVFFFNCFGLYNFVAFSNKQKVNTIFFTNHLSFILLYFINTFILFYFLFCLSIKISIIFYMKLDS